MKFQGKVDLWAWALLIFVNVLVLWSVIPAAGGEKEEIASVITALIVLVLVDLLMVPIYFRNYIYLGEQELLIVFGFIKNVFGTETLNCLRRHTIRFHHLLCRWTGFIFIQIPGMMFLLL